MPVLVPTIPARDAQLAALVAAEADRRRRAGHRRRCERYRAKVRRMHHAARLAHLPDGSTPEGRIARRRECQRRWVAAKRAKIARLRPLVQSHGTGPVIAVGDVAPYESVAQAARVFGVAGRTIRRAIAGKTRVGGRPWLVAGWALRRAVTQGGWAMAVKRGMVPKTFLWAAELGWLRPPAQAKALRVQTQRQAAA